MNRDAKCFTCKGMKRHNCRHCGGLGGPGKRGHGVGGDKGRCHACLGVGTVDCGYCGGVGVVPHRLASHAV